jgi:hypothetical protein
LAERISLGETSIDDEQCLRNEHLLVR